MHLEVIKSEARPVFEKLDHFGLQFYLAGGTALALQIGHRISVDFDLFSSENLSNNLRDQLEKVYSHSPIKPLAVQSDQITVSINDVQLTFLNYPYPPILPLVEFEPIRLLSIFEIAATKAYSLGRRATFKDYVDLYFIVKNNYHELSKIIDLAEQKYKTSFNRKLFLEQLVYLKDVDEIEINFLCPSITKKEVEEFFKDQIEKIEI